MIPKPGAVVYNPYRMPPLTQRSALENVAATGAAYLAAKGAVTVAHDEVAAQACSLRDLGYQRVDLERTMKRPLDAWIEREDYRLDTSASVDRLGAALGVLADSIRDKVKALNALTKAATTARNQNATLPAIAKAAGVTERYAQQLVLRGKNHNQWAAKVYRQKGTP